MSSQPTPSTEPAERVLEAAGVLGGYGASTVHPRFFGFGEPFLHLGYAVDVLEAVSKLYTRNGPRQFESLRGGGGWNNAMLAS